MSYHASALQVSRHTKRTLYVIAGLYVAVGFALAAASAVQGDRLGTFLGFLIISAALVAATVVRAVLRMEVCVAAIAEGVDDLRGRLIRVEAAAGELRGQMTGQGHLAVGVGNVRMLDLAAVGSGDPSPITAATLDRRVFPRLVSTMNDEPPAQSAAVDPPIDGYMDEYMESPEADSWDELAAESAECEEPSLAEEATLGSGPATKNLLRQWKVAIRNGDLSECRAVYSALIDTAGPQAVAPLGMQMETLADRIERELREAFAARVRDKDYAAALALGERLRCLLPDRPVAAEFQRLAPMLLRRLTPTAPAVAPLVGEGT